MKRLTREVFIDRAKKTHGEKYKYDNVEFKNVSTPVEIFCTIHQCSFFQRPDNHMAGQGCKKCATEKTSNKTSLTKKDFVEKSKAIHGDKYDYSQSKIVRANVPTTIICPIHGAFKQKPQHHMNGSQCQLCANEERAKFKSLTHEDFVLRATETHDGAYSYEKSIYKSNRDKLTITCPIHGDFEQTPEMHLRGSGCSKCVRADKQSSGEREVCEFLDSLGVRYITSDRELIAPKEIDIYLPDHNIAIEYDGMYWHSTNLEEECVRMSKQHINKTEQCESIGVQLFHIFESEWNNPLRKKAWKSMLRVKVGMAERIFARKCKIEPIKPSQAKIFCAKNHIQGEAQTSKAYALTHDSEIVMVVTMNRCQAKAYEWEMNRCCSKLDTVVVGGFSKLLNHIKQLHGTSIVTYANRRFSIGNVYEVAGLKNKGYSAPSYWYWKPTEPLALHNKRMFRRKALEKKLNRFDPSKSERRNMFDHGYRRIWDCGTIVYTL